MGSKVLALPLLLACLSTANCGLGLAFRGAHRTPTTPGARAQTGTRTGTRRLPSIPAGVVEARVHAAAAEWLLLHSSLRGDTAQSAVADSCEYEKVEKKKDRNLFSLIQNLILPPPVDARPRLVCAIGLADLPREASPLQIYELLAATDSSVRELDATAHALRSEDLMHSGVRSLGFRGGVEAVRGGAERRRRYSDTDFTLLYCGGMNVPVLCKTYREGDEEWRMRTKEVSHRSSRNASWGEGWWGERISPRLSTVATPEYLRGGSGEGWSRWASFLPQGVQVRRVPGA
mmetsp:Transcript_91136/g.147234  ORF Transcript_91136/g.147234 Transcript_91136/m.147234 type:complete len:289 (-) Transcript_91136:10-876(-)